MNDRVTHYTGTAYYTSTGSSSSREYAFTQVQADEVGAVLEPDGIPLKAAQRLCEKWTARGQGTSIRYSYSPVRK